MAVDDRYRAVTPSATYNEIRDGVSAQAALYPYPGEIRIADLADMMGMSYSAFKYHYKKIAPLPQSRRGYVFLSIALTAVERYYAKYPNEVKPS